MTENSKEKDEKVTEVNEAQGMHISRKSLGIALGVVVLFIVLVSAINKKEPVTQKKEAKFEEKMTISDVSDLPTSYAEIRDIEEPEYVDYSANYDYSKPQEPTYQERSPADEERARKLEQLHQEADTARRSGIGFITDNNNYEQNNSTRGRNGANYPPDYDLNRQGSKKSFLKNEEANPSYLNNVEEDPISPYEVKAGTIIPGVMITGINSDLPGNIVGQVRESVFDTVTGNYLLIPQGTKIFGAYDANVTWGQERALIVWQRLIFPDGRSINLSNMPGVDLTGQAGFKDRVNNHFGTLLKGVVLSSIAGAGAAIITDDDNDDNDTDYASEAGRAAGIAIINVGNKFADKALDRQPTIEIRPGYRFNIMVHRDMILTPYENY